MRCKDEGTCQVTDGWTGASSFYFEMNTEHRWCQCNVQYAFGTQLSWNNSPIQNF